MRSYLPLFFWWELVIVAEKIFLTSVMVLVLPGTLMQLVVALGVKLCVSLVQTIAAPCAPLAVEHAPLARAD